MLAVERIIFRSIVRNTLLASLQYYFIPIANYRHVVTIKQIFRVRELLRTFDKFWQISECNSPPLVSHNWRETSFLRAYRLRLRNWSVSGTSRRLFHCRFAFQARLAAIRELRIPRFTLFRGSCPPFRTRASNASPTFPQSTAIHWYTSSSPGSCCCLVANAGEIFEISAFRLLLTFGKLPSTFVFRKLEDIAQYVTPLPFVWNDSVFTVKFFVVSWQRTRIWNFVDMDRDENMRQ